MTDSFSSSILSSPRSGSSGTFSSTNLENRLHALREKSNALSQTLTQKLATSQSGQNLLHIGPSLSTLPPDLHSLQINLTPLLADVETYESQSRSELKRIVDLANNIRIAQRRSNQAKDCAAMYHDLLSAEALVSSDEDCYDGAEEHKNQVNNYGDDVDPLEHLSSLERTAHITLHLIQELKYSTDQASAMTTFSSHNNSNVNHLPSMTDPLPQATEKAQFLMKLAPRIRRLESEVIKCLIRKMERILQDIMQKNEENNDAGNYPHGMGIGAAVGDTDVHFWMGCHRTDEQQSLLAIGHCLRGLALLGRGKEAEKTFARVAIVPIIRSKLSMGKLDEGGSRGQCAGLFSVLDDMACTISKKFGSVIRLSEDIFDVSALEAAEQLSSDSDVFMNVDIDLVAAGVWLPIATAMMADSTIKMAIFSPGIATILQGNYAAFDVFLSELAKRLLKQENEDTSSTNAQSDTLNPLLTTSYISETTIESCQKRIYRHPITSDFSRKWNLPIYYQLRFGESCTRLDAAIAKVQSSGWLTNVFSGSDDTAQDIMNTYGFEVPLFIELYDILLSLWKPDVIIRPLTHRFLRGSLQLIGRTVGFVKDGLEGKIHFGSADEASKTSWAENIGDVATVAWELTVLESCMNYDYLTMVVETIIPENVSDMSNICNSREELDELEGLISEVFMDAAQDLGPLIEKLWSEIIVNILTKSCSGPLSAVKGVAATYRMTNRPPPTQASPFVSMILRPLKEFDENFSSRTPPQVGTEWKTQVVSIVAERYSVAVSELLETVKRTEVALKNRKARRFATSGMSDGEKVKLQLYLDYKEFANNVSEIGIDIAEIEGVLKLGTLTIEAESLISEKN